MWKFGRVLDKYWVEQSGNFRLTTAVALGMGIIDTKLLFCDGISEKNKNKQITIGEYNGRTLCDFFNNLFEFYYGISALNIPPIAIDNSNFPLKRDHYTSGPIPATISVASKSSGSTLISPFHP